MINNTQTSNLSTSQNAEVHQILQPDYTGIFCFSGIIFILGLLVIICANYWIKKFFDSYNEKIKKEIEFVGSFYEGLKGNLQVIENTNKEIMEKLNNG